MNWSLKTNRRLLTAVTSVISAATGAAVSYAVAYKILEKKFDEELQDQIQAAKVHYQRFYSKPELVAETEDESMPEELASKIREATEEFDGVPVDLVGRALDASRVYEGRDKDDDDDRRAPVINNVFINATAPGEEVLGALLADRDVTKPYIITKEEYFENKPEHDQFAFTYFEGDATLIDDREEFDPIMDIDKVAGDDNLLHFGYGSKDQNVVYIRNEAVKPPMDLAVTRSSGKYSDEVMGEMDDSSPHLQHSKTRKFRLNDD